MYSINSRNFLLMESQQRVIAQPQGSDIQYHFGTNMKQLLTNCIVPTTCWKAGTIASDSLINTIRIFTQWLEKYRKNKVIQRRVLTNQPWERMLKRRLPRNGTNYRDAWNQLPHVQHQAQTGVFTIRCSKCKYFIELSFREICCREN